MSAPHEPEDDSRQLIRYLLGDLPGDETERLDEASIVDDEVASRLRDVENDLVDAYVRGELAPDVRERFETAYLGSPRRRQKVAFAEALLGVAHRAVVPVDAAAAPAPPRVAGALHDPGPAAARGGPAGSRSLSWSGLVVAAILLLVVGSGLFVGEMRARKGLLAARQETAAFERRARDLEQQLQEHRAANAETVQELERATAALAELIKRGPGDANAAAGGQASAAATRVVFVLAPPTRAAEPLPEMVVPPGTDAVTFDLQLDANDFARYEAALKDPETARVVWRSRRVVARSAGDRATVTLLVPAAVLAAQSYAFELSGYSAGDAGEVAGVYAFRIVRR